MPNLASSLSYVHTCLVRTSNDAHARASSTHPCPAHAPLSPPAPGMLLLACCWGRPSARRHQAVTRTRHVHVPPSHPPRSQHAHHAATHVLPTMINVYSCVCTHVCLCTRVPACAPPEWAAQEARKIRSSRAGGEQDTELTSRRCARYGAHEQEASSRCA